ncbi:MAG TPA: FtsX-like permease family protein [Galbitalea sp.]|jgi:putative ABC transport system permease protein|nr:FtsX-like permease family protein [Galbitalea sp.]
MNRFAPREHLSSILVAALSSTFGVVLLLATGDLATLIERSNASDHGAVRAALSVVAWVFLAVALYTAAVVTSNTFATIIAGRTKTIALLRLLGASARSQRAAVAREGLAVGVIGGLAGLALGIGLNAAFLGISIATGFIPWLNFSLADVTTVMPVVAVVLTTWLASWVGSRRVLVVSPIEAIGASEDRNVVEVSRRPARNVIAVLVVVTGTLIMLGGVDLALSPSAAGLLVAVFGGMVSFTGVVLASQLVMPPALRLAGRAMGSSASARLAAQNAVRYPERSARTTVGIVIGVTLITMFSVALQTYSVFIDRARAVDPQEFQGMQQILSTVSVIFTVISGFSALIAAVGMVNNLSLSVVQRIRELGLLRALGFTASQVRRMIVAESAQLTITAAVMGLVLGTFYGWAGAECLVGMNRFSGGIIWPAFSPVLIAVIAVAAAVLVWAASLAPSRRATRVTPVEALAVE